MIEKLREKDIYVTEEYFPMEIWGTVYYSTHGTYHIGINNRLAQNTKEEVLEHELNHINKDAPRCPYIIGVDMQHKSFENQEESNIHKLLSNL